MTNLDLTKPIVIAATDWQEELPARGFPPSGLWGATDHAKEHGVGQSLLTFHDDWCGEYQEKTDAV